MKRALFAALLTTAASAAMAADVGVSISIGQPGFYGQIDIGNAPRPVLVYPQPVVIQRAVSPVQPVYLHVPPGHAKDWGKHCHKYNACARPVYFVKDDWYNNVYVPHYEQERAKARARGTKATARAKATRPFLHTHCDRLARTPTALRGRTTARPTRLNSVDVARARSAGAVPALVSCDRGRRLRRLAPATRKWFRSTRLQPCVN
jgi:hypothetical protein